MTLDKLEIEKKVRLLTEKLQDKTFISKLEKNAPKALAEIGLDVKKEFPQTLKLDLTSPIEVQFPWHLVEIKWYPYWPWRYPYWPWRYPWWPGHHKPELPLYTSDCCCCCCHH